MIVTYYLCLLLAAYLAANFFVGCYHMLTDKGWNIPQQVQAFQEHHSGAVVFDLKPVYFALPVVLLGLCWQLPFVAAFAFFAGLSEFAHYAAHQPAACPGFMRGLQAVHLIIAPTTHAKHHDGRFNRHYCVLSGWTNGLVNRLARWVPMRA